MGRNWQNLKDVAEMEAFLAARASSVGSGQPVQYFIPPPLPARGSDCFPYSVFTTLFSRNQVLDFYFLFTLSSFLARMRYLALPYRKLPEDRDSPPGTRGRGGRSARASLRCGSQCAFQWLLSQSRFTSPIPAFAKRA